MSAAISLLNGTIVGIYGCILSASFCGIWKDTKKRRNLTCGYILLQLIQGIVCFAWDETMVRFLYPAIVHLPLLLLLWYITKKFALSFVAVMTAYLCCQLRRWLALLIVLFLPKNSMAQDLVEVVLTIPLLLYIMRGVSPSFRRLTGYSLKRQWQFGVIPILYYLFDYITIVYTDWYYQALPVAMEFVPFVCCAAYLSFLGYNSREEQKMAEQEKVKQCLDLQLGQSLREVQAMRESWELTKRYRHDLRHHLQYVSSCIENGQYETAQHYILDICSEVEGHKVHSYCENEEVNLLFSSFIGRAEKADIRVDVKSAVPAKVRVSDGDLCVLLSNALENAMHACLLCEDAAQRRIQVQLFERNDKLFLEVTNPCAEEVLFEDGLPVTEKSGHGIGVQSICAIVKKYDGIYSFQLKEGWFYIRISI